MKKHYYRPNLQVVKLQQKGCLLTGASSQTEGLKATISGYEEDNDGGFLQDNDE